MERSLKLALAGILSSFCVVASAADLGLAIGARNGDLRSLLGINIGPLPAASANNADLTAVYRQLGIDLIRTHDYYGPLDMATLYPDRSKNPALSTSYNFTAPVSSEGRSSDTVFASIVDNGFEPFFRIGDSYNNSTPPSDAQLGNWVQASINVLKHYRQGQWNGFNNSFRYVEIWNEPDNLTFWPRPFTSTQFFSLYDTTARALRTAFPELIIGGPAITHNGCTSTNGKAWTAAFLDHVKARGSPLDYFSWHIYSNSADDIAACAAYFRQALDERGFTTVPTIVSEWNTDDRSVDAGEGLQVRTQSKGAAILTGAWIGLQNRDDIEQTLFYRGPDPSMDAPFFYGIYYADGQPKKIGLAWQLWREIGRYAHRLGVSGGQSGIYTLAAENDDGARALLLANTGASVANWTPSFADGKTLADYHVVTRAVSDANDSIATVATSSSRFSLPAQSVQLALLTPRAQTFAATATGSGDSDSYTLTASVRVAAADVGREGGIYLAAQTDNALYLHNGTSWQAYTDGPLPAWQTGSLPSTVTVPVLNKADSQGLTGIKVYLGYGLDSDDLLRRSQYRLVHTF